MLADLRVAARLPSLQQYLQDRTAERRQVFSVALQNMMEAYPRYGQIQLLDLSGREVVRVKEADGRAVVVPEAQLHDQSERSDFKAALALESGKVYLSPVDLNVENGQIEVPYRPTLRVAAPVYDSAGERRAILVLSVRGDDMLDRFREITKTEPLQEAMLLNPDGYWLSNGADGREWGFMFGRKDATFGNAYPAEWRSIGAADHGVFRTRLGIFVHATVHAPPSAREANAGESASTPGGADQPPYLKIVLHVPSASLRRLLFLYLPLGRVLLSTVYVSLLPLSIVIAYIWLYPRRARELERVAAREIADLYGRAPCGYHSLDRDGLVVRMNRTELEWLGYRHDEVVGRMKITDLMTADSRRTFAENFPHFVETGYIGNIDLEFLRKDGSVLPVAVSASAAWDDAGEFLMSRSTVFDATERRKLELELMRQASTDPLTGIGNRRHFFELAEHELARCRRERSALSLLLIDIDEFKSINDRWGHDTGDAVLKSMALACKAELRAADVLARVGGEEFVVALPATDAVEARVIADRLRRILAELLVPRANA